MKIFSRKNHAEKHSSTSRKTEIKKRDTSDEKTNCKYTAQSHITNAKKNEKNAQIFFAFPGSKKVRKKQRKIPPPSRIEIG